MLVGPEGMGSTEALRLAQKHNLLVLDKDTKPAAAAA